MSILVTGGAGFIGSNFVRQWLHDSSEHVVVIDKLTYAGNLSSLEEVMGNHAFSFYQCDIGDRDATAKILANHRPRAIINFAAETHVDKSISSPDRFISTNIVGTFDFLESVRLYWVDLSRELKSKFRFLHVSTDEVFGTLAPHDAPFAEINRYEPNSPYSASKAASDHLVRAWHHTYGLPILTTNCSNNYGPYHLPEKLIPLVIRRALSHEGIPVYGDGLQKRDWLYVMDHCAAIRLVLDKGSVGETYNIGGSNEITNIEVVTAICAILDEVIPMPNLEKYESLIKFVQDRPGHDRRYAINATKVQSELGWHACETFDSGLRKTVEWYLENLKWLKLAGENLDGYHSSSSPKK